MANYSEIKIVTVPKMRVARYVIISPNPEDDVNRYMDEWAERSGLLQFENYAPRRIGWDFPFVSKQQTEEFGLRGYVCAYLIPEIFEVNCHGAEIAYIEEDTYATIRVTDPFSDPFTTIPKGYELLMNYINGSEYKTLTWENRIAFEEVVEIEDVVYMDIYVPVK